MRPVTFVEPSAHPFAVDVTKLTDELEVQGPWSNGRTIDLNAFMTRIQAIDPSELEDRPVAVAARHGIG